MTILKVPSYYFPEQISSSHLSKDLTEAWVKAGFTTINYVPTPCRGISDEVRERYKKIKYEEQANGKIIVHRFSMFKEGKNPIQRAFRYLLVNLLQYSKGSKLNDIDLIYSGSTPPTQGLLCGSIKKKLSKRYGRPVPYIYKLQDVFPDSLVSTGLTTKGSWIWKIGRKIEDRTYKAADKIIVISEDIRSNIIEKGVPAEKITIVPNWIDTNEVHPISRKDNKLFDELGIDRKKFIVVYAGNLGMAQGIDTILEAAKKTNEVEFLIFGEGSCKEEYSERSKGFENIHILPLMPSSRVSEVYSMGDMGLVACKKGTGTGAMPSKTFSIMAAETPVLLSFDEGTALWRLISEKRCGVCVHADDVEELAGTINHVKNQGNLLAQMGKNARECVEKEYSKEIGTDSIVGLMKSMVEAGGG